MGNYESCRVDIGIEDNRHPSEDIDKAVARVYDKVEGFLIKKVTDLEEEINSVKG